MKLETTLVIKELVGTDYVIEYEGAPPPIGKVVSLARDGDDPYRNIRAVSEEWSIELRGPSQPTIQCNCYCEFVECVDGDWRAIEKKEWTIGTLTEVIRSYESIHAPGSETELWGAYLEDTCKETGYMAYNADHDDVPVGKEFARFWLRKYEALEVKS